jgi:hypothetical protein
MGADLGIKKENTLFLIRKSAEIRQNDEIVTVFTTTVFTIIFFNVLVHRQIFCKPVNKKSNKKKNGKFFIFEKVVK